MMIDLRYKNAPLFAISIAFYLFATTMAEAAPNSTELSTLSQTPDEAVRQLVSAQADQGYAQHAIFPNPSEVFSVKGNGAKQSRLIVTGSFANAKAPKPVDIIVADITNRSTASIAAKPVPSKSFAPPNQPIAVIPSSADLAVIKPNQSDPQPTSTASAVTDRVEATAPFSAKPAENKAPSEKPKALPKPEETKENSAEPLIINKSIVPDNITLPKKLSLDGVEQLTNKLVSGSQQLMLSIQSDSSARLFMGSTHLEIQPAVGSRLMLETAVHPSQGINLSSPDPSSALLVQTTKPAKPSAIRLLLTADHISDRKSAVAFSVIGTHGFANKPNV